MTTEKIDWISKLGILSSLRTQLEQLQANSLFVETNSYRMGRIYQLEQIIEEIERT